MANTRNRKNKDGYYEPTPKHKRRVIQYQDKEPDLVDRFEIAKRFGPRGFAISIAVLLAISAFFYPRTTRRRFNSIEIGMPYSRVKEIMHRPDKRITHDSNSFELEWIVSKGGRVRESWTYYRILIVNDRVAHKDVEVHRFR